jgi:hypothetical protein
MLKNEDFHENTEAERVEQFPIWQELVNSMPKAYILFVTSIHQSTIFFIKIAVVVLYWIEIIQPFLNLKGHQNTFHSII